MAFEFGAYRYGLERALRPGTPLARIFSPRTQLVVTKSEVVLVGADDRHADVLQRLLADGVPAAAQPTVLDVRDDTGGYRERVSTAIDEIVGGRYQKVILSRRFDVPFALAWYAAVIEMLTAMTTARVTAPSAAPDRAR